MLRLTTHLKERRLTSSAERVNVLELARVVVIPHAYGVVKDAPSSVTIVWGHVRKAVNAHDVDV